jgi:hypothetical protein
MYDLENLCATKVHASFETQQVGKLSVEVVLIPCKSSPVTGLEWPREFQEVKVPRFHDNGTGWW